MISFSQRFKERPIPTPTEGVAPMWQPPMAQAPTAPVQSFAGMPFEQVLQLINQYNSQQGQQGQTLQASQQFGPDGTARTQVHSGRLGPDGVFRLEDEMGEMPGLGEGLGLQAMVRNPQTGMMVSRNTYEGQVGMKYQGPYGQQSPPGPNPGRGSNPMYSPPTQGGAYSQASNPQRGGRPIFGNLSSLGFSSRR